MDLATILTWFKRGCKPTEAQFAATFQSFRHKDDAITMGDVSGLSMTLAGKSEVGHTHTLAEITDYDGGDKEVINAMVAQDSTELEAFTKTAGMYYILLSDDLLYECVHDEDTDTDTLTEVEPDGKVVYSAYDADDNLHIYLYNVPNLMFQDVTNEQVDKTIYTNNLDGLISKQLENGLYAVVLINSDIQGNAFGDSYTLTVGDSTILSRVLESRSGWAQLVLNNGSYEWQWHRYSYEGHNHDTAYAGINHNHDTAYAGINHNHDSAYAAKNHTHSDYLTQHQDISGKQDKTDNSLQTTAKTIVGAINELFTSLASVLSFAKVRAYTLDFGTAGELIQDVNMLGAITINELQAFNVAHLYVTYGTVSHQEIDLTQPVSLNVANHTIIIWEIVRTTDDGLASVGVRCSINS